jgi:hypothetical protein
MSQGLARPEPERLLSADELAPNLGMSLDWVIGGQRPATFRVSFCRAVGGSSSTPRFAK